MARKTAFLGLGPDYFNFVAQKYMTLTAGGPNPASMLPAQLATEEPTERCRITTLDPKQTWFHADSGLLVQCPIDGVALVNLNLSPWGLYRFTPSLSSGANMFITQAPTSIIASNNITGPVTNVDEAITDASGNSASDAAYIVPTGTTGQWDARFGFAAAAGSFAGAGNTKGFFVLRVGLVNAPVNFYPAIGLELWDSGVFRSYLGRRAVTAADQILIFPFDKSLLNNTNGSTIQVRVVGDPDASGTAYARLDTLNLYYDGNTLGADSGWQSSPFRVDDNSAAPTKSVHYFFSAAVNSYLMHAVIVDDQTTHFTSAMSGVGIAKGMVSLLPDGYVQAGVMCAGPALFLSRGVRAPGGASLRIATEERGGVTEGGQTYAADVFRRRAAEADLIITRTEADALMDTLDWRRGHSGAFFVALEADLAMSFQLFTAFWATLKDGGSTIPLPVKYQPDGTMMYGRTISVEEKL